MIKNLVVRGIWFLKILTAYLNLPVRLVQWTGKSKYPVHPKHLQWVISHLLLPEDGAGYRLRQQDAYASAAMLPGFMVSMLTRPTCGSPGRPLSAGWQHFIPTGGRRRASHSGLLKSLFRMWGISRGPSLMVRRAKGGSGR
jgi:hypothetical protein